MSKKPKPFLSAKHKWLSEIIQIDTPANSRKACKKLSGIWRNPKSNKYFRPFEQYVDERATRRLLQQAVCEAIRRSKAQLQRKTLSTKERVEFKQIVKIYAKWLKQHRLVKR